MAQTTGTKLGFNKLVSHTGGYPCTCPDESCTKAHSRRRWECQQCSAIFCGVCHDMYPEQTDDSYYDSYYLIIHECPRCGAGHTLT